MPELRLPGALLLLPLMLAAPVRPQATAPATLDRILVLGASASAGFGIRQEVGQRFTLAMLLERMVKTGSHKILDTTSEFFFLDPEGSTRRAIRKGEAFSPTLVVAFDFLFWFGYGDQPDAPARLESLETGLRFLEEFSCPVVIAEIPDMKAAVGRMLRPEQIPAPQELDRLNRRIRAWAAGRKNVILLPLATLLSRPGGPGEPHVNDPRLLQADQLHPTLEGLASIAALVLRSVARARKDVDPAGLDLDPAAVVGSIRREMDRALGG